MSRPSVARRRFGRLPGGSPVDCFTVESEAGVRVELLTLGAAVRSVCIPGRDGGLADVTLGLETVEAYLAHRDYLGAVVGRFANRVAHGRFDLDGREYQLPANDGDHTLHGGPTGFDRRLWDAEPFETPSTAGVVFRLTSADGDQGFPGELAVEAGYRLSGTELRIDLEATATEPTIVNLTSHAYWNLAGAGSGTVDDHLLSIHAGRFTPIREGGIPTGAIIPVAGSPFDFTSPRAIGDRIDDRDGQLALGGGYDHNYVLDPPPGAPTLPRLAATLSHPASGRSLEVHTTEPGLQLYTGNALGHPFGIRGGVALECQHFPDAPNQPSFPSTVLRPGETFESTTIYRFGTFT